MRLITGGYLVVAVLVAAGGFGAGVAWRATLAIATGFLAVGLLRIGRARLGLVRRRRAADALLRIGVKVHPQSELLIWRAAQLTSDRNRRMLARSLKRIVSELERPSLVRSAVPLNRRSLRPHLPLIRLLAARLAQLERSVTAQGVVLVEDLLTDGYAGPLYLGGHAEDLPTAINRCLAALNDNSGRLQAPGSTADVARPAESNREELSRYGGHEKRVGSGRGR